MKNKKNYLFGCSLLVFIFSFTACDNKPPETELASIVKETIAKNNQFKDGYFKKRFGLLEIPNEVAREIYEINSRQGFGVGMDLDDNYTDFDQTILSAVNEIAEIQYVGQRPYYFYNDTLDAFMQKSIITKNMEKQKHTYIKVYKFTPTGTYELKKGKTPERNPQPGIEYSPYYIEIKCIATPFFKKLKTEIVYLHINLQQKEGKWEGYFSHNTDYVDQEQAYLFDQVGNNLDVIKGRLKTAYANTN
jgi:hypothetical protein